MSLGSNKQKLLENDDFDSSYKHKFTEENKVEMFSSGDNSNKSKLSKTQGPNYLKKRIGDMEDSEPQSTGSTPKTPAESVSEISTGQYPSITNLRSNFGKQRSPKFNYNNENYVGNFTINENKTVPNKNHKLCFLILSKIMKVSLAIP